MSSVIADHRNGNGRAGSAPSCQNRHVPLHPQAEAVLAMMAALGEAPLEQCTPEQAREIRARRLRSPTEPIHQSTTSTPAAFLLGSTGRTIATTSGCWCSSMEA